MVPDSIPAQFREAGINPPHFIMPTERIERFPVSPDDKKNSGWYIGFMHPIKNGDNFFVFVFGDNHNPDQEFTATSGSTTNRNDKRNISDYLAKAKKIKQAERQELNRDTKIKANQLWEKLTDAFGKNEYLEKKGIEKLYGARIDGFNLRVPMRDEHGEIHNIETISATGEGFSKKGLFGGRRDGLMHQIGKIKDVIYVCEGFSTGVAIHEAMNDCVVIAFNSGNLVKVGQALVRKYPDKRFVFCADNDRFPNKKGQINNVGVDKATEAANLCGGKIVIPQFEEESKGTDFDDLKRELSSKEVRKQILVIKPLEKVLRYDPKFVVEHPYPDDGEIDAQGNKQRKGTIENIDEMLRRLRITVRYNVISKEQEIIIPGASYSMDNRINASYAEIQSWCDRCRINSKNLNGALTVLTDRNRFNPVATWIDSIPWDGEKRIQKLCDTVVAKDQDTDINILCMKEKLIRTWMISAVAAVFEPYGVSAHGILTFQGAQYLGKTKWFKSLVPREMQHVVSDGVILDVRNKDSVFQAVSKWLVELGELDATLKSTGASPFKAFVTRDRDPIRLPYAKGYSEFPRRTVFFGSVNHDDYLKDPTGNRRFWTIECVDLKHDHNLDMQQVWAEVAEIYRAGETWFLSAEEVDALNAHNEEFEQVDPIYERILAHYNWSLERVVPLTSTEICLQIGINNPNYKDSQAAGRALKRITGKGRTNISGNRKGYLVPPEKGKPRF